jgi:alpha-1,2-mannosyltransferase
VVGSTPTVRRAGIIAALAAAATGFAVLTSARHGFFDLKVYYGALNYWVHGGGELYDYLRPNSRYGFTYPPFAALLMVPMAYVGWHVAIVISVFFSVVGTVAVLWWLVDPLARWHGRSRWFALAVALCLAVAFEPLRETVNFGQVNVLLLALVGADLLLLVDRGSRLGGIGIGLATAIKLTPGIFIAYLLLTRRWRAAALASATAAAASLFAAVLAPDASREFWTQALWNTDRVGSLAFVSNQSLQGVVARLNPDDPSTLLWLVLVVATLAVWAWRARAAVAAGDEVGGWALTAVVGCLVSPVTWVHHLVWLMPALVLLFGRALDARPGSRGRRRLLGLAVVSYGLLISRVVWIWQHGSGGVLGFLGSNAYVWVSIALLLALPVGSPARRPAQLYGVTHLGEVGPGAAVAADPVHRPFTVWR